MASLRIGFAKVHTRARARRAVDIRRVIFNFFNCE
jgi:hypothetical protein